VKPPDGWSTHQEALVWAASRTTGSIVELGGGWYSTPILHGLCEPGRRELWTVEAEAEWLHAVKPWQRSWHHLVLDPGLNIPAQAGRPGMVFVDHDATPPGRSASIRQAAERGASIIVVHDTQPAAAHDYPGMAEVIDRFRYRRDWRYYPQWTTALSNKVSLNAS